MDDQISELPEEILVSILSCLSLKEATRTSILSSRWRYLWTYFNGNIQFYEDDWNLDWSNFVDRINGILKLLKSSRPENFTVVYQKVYSVEDIYPWIEFVAKKDVKIFQLKLGNKNIRSSSGTLSALPYLSFGSLKTVRWGYVDVSNEMVQYMLSNSPNLKTLDLLKLKGLSCLSIPSASLMKLRRLSLVACYNLRNVNISSKSLKHLSITGRVDIDAKKIPKLKSVTFGDYRCKTPSQLIYRLLGYKFPPGQLQRLCLSLELMEEYGMDGIKHFNLPTLKHLEFIIDPEGGNAMLNCINLLQTASPTLHTLEITLGWRHEEFLEEEILYEKIVRLNRSIKVLKLTQFLGNEMDIMFMKNLIESSESLRKLVISPFRANFKLSDGAESRANERIKDLCEEGILSKRSLTSRIELVIEWNRFPRMNYE